MKYLILLTFLCTCGPAQAQTHEGIFVFGHSLIDHRPPMIATPSDETTVPHWLQLLAAEAGNTAAVGGQYGFLTSHRNLPPISQWGYDIVPGVWDQDNETFAEAPISSTLITIGNFIQNEMSPTDDYYGPENVGVTPVTATHDIVDWVEQQRPGTKVYIYENWPETNLAFPPPMAAPTYPISTIEFATYNTYTQGAFHNWWITYHDELLASHPDLNVRMIPVGPTLAKLFSGNLADQIPYTELYEDLDPHGRASLYFLAGLITYAAIYQEPPPASFTVPTIVHEDIRDNYAAISAFIWSELQAFNTPSGESRVFQDGALPVVLSSFAAEDLPGIIELTWSTAAEDNLNRFAVERSGADGDFVEIGIVDAQNQPSNYAFTDNDPLTGENIYRLRIEDQDNNDTYSSLVTVTREGTNSVQLLPLGNGRFQLAEAPRGTDYYLTDATGRLLRSGRIQQRGELFRLSGNGFTGVGFLVAVLPGQRPVHFKVVLTK